MKYTPKYIRKILSKTISEISSNPQVFSKNAERDFSRTRKLPFEKVVKSILSMSCKDLKWEIMDIFNYNSDIPTVSAFVQQRAKIPSVAFETLFKNFTSSFIKKQLYKGYRLLAVDGSDLHTPTNQKETNSFYSGTNGQKPYNLMYLNALYDIMNNLYVDAIVQPSHNTNEHKTFVSIVDRDISTYPTIYIADRGYESYNNLAHIQEEGQFFLIRIKDITGNGISRRLDLPQSDEFDTFVNSCLTRKQTNTVKADKTLSYLTRNINFDYPPSRCKKTDPLEIFCIPFRIVRIKISENKHELLITNLEPEDFSPEGLKQIYSMRWGIETSFRTLKYTLGLVYFHSKKEEYITQEIFAKLTMYNFTELITSHVVTRQKKRKFPFKVYFSASVHICRSFFSDNISSSLVEALISKYVVPIRQSVSNPRKMNSKTAVCFLYRVA